MSMLTGDPVDEVHSGEVELSAKVGVLLMVGFAIFSLLMLSLWALH